MEAEGDRKKLSFSYHVGGEKLRLIDVDKEDDFLIDFPLLDSVDDLRLSVTFNNINQHEDCDLLVCQTAQNAENAPALLLQNEHHLSPSYSIEPARPSYLRKSLAWDDAFFTSAGVLDPDELTFINKGLKVDLRNREAKSIINGKGSSSAARESNLCDQNKLKNKRPLKKQVINTQRSEQRNLKRISGREEFHEMSIKPPKSSDRLKNLSKDHSKSASWCSYDLKKGNRAATTGSAEVRTASSSSRDTFASVSCSKYPGSLATSKLESREGNLCASAPVSWTRPCLLKKDFGDPKFPDSSILITNGSSCILHASFPDASSSGSTSRCNQQREEIETCFDASAASAWTSLEDDVIQGSNLLNASRRKSSLSMQSMKMNSLGLPKTRDTMDASSITTESRKRLKPSGLRQPLPKIGFFDEVKTSAAGRVDLQLPFEMLRSPPSRNRSSIKAAPGKLQVGRGTPESSRIKLGSLGDHVLYPPSARQRNASSGEKFRSSSTKVSNKLKNRSNASHQCRNHGEVEEHICCNSRKTCHGKCHKQRARQNSELKQDDRTSVKGKLKAQISREKGGLKDENTIQKSSSQQRVAVNLHSSAELENKVDALSRYLETIDLSSEANMEALPAIKTTCFDGEDMHFDQQKHSPTSPKPSQLHLTDNKCLSNSRTPLADKTTICNRVESCESSLKSSKAKVSTKTSHGSPFQLTAKENSPGI